MSTLFEVVTYYCWMECDICHEQTEEGKESKWVKIKGKRICLSCFDRGILQAIKEAWWEKHAF